MLNLDREEILTKGV